MTDRKNHFLFIILTILLLSTFFTSCQKRYWYREKGYVFGHSQRLKRIHLTVNNRSPEYLSDQFKNNIRKFCLKRLSKFGFEETKKDTAEFDFVIELQVDSFHTKGISLFDKRYHVYKNFVMQLSISYLITNPRKKLKVWENKDEFYFFEDEPKDFTRSKSMIKYSFKQMPEIN